MQHPHFYFNNGKYTPSNATTVSIHDIGLLRGFALFESLRTYDGEPFLLHEHLVRMFKGLKFAGIKSPYSILQLDRLVRGLVKKNKLQDALIRIIITAGPTQSLVPQNKPTVLILVDPLHPFPSWQYEKGIAIKTTTFPRLHPSIKSTVYFSAVMESQKALKEGYHEIAYSDAKGALLEGSTFNIFAVLPGPKLVTPQKDVLAGITAECILTIAKKARVPVLRTPITPALLRKATELFITSSNRELIPAVRVNRLKIGKGKPGPITQQLLEIYRTMVCHHCHHH